MQLSLKDVSKMYLFVPEPGAPYLINTFTSEIEYQSQSDVKHELLGNYFYHNNLLIEFEDRFEVVDLKLTSSIVYMKRKTKEIAMPFYDTFIRFNFNV